MVLSSGCLLGHPRWTLGLLCRVAFAWSKVERVKRACRALSMSICPFVGTPTRTAETLHDLHVVRRASCVVRFVTYDIYRRADPLLIW